MNKKGLALGLPKGFTLIELMVVLSIIGVLAALTLTGIGSSRKTARDATRKSHLETIRGGLEMYKSDCNIYPAGIGSQVPSPLVGSGSPASCDEDNTYISVVPRDPLDTARYYRYRRLTTTSYEICAALETGTGPVDCYYSNCGTGVDCNYRITNP